MHMTPTREPLALPGGRVRQALVRVGGAVLAAVLLKWLCLEAYRIPSPSMQPMLLGCDEAGVHDHVLVDKLHYVLAEPRRWELAVVKAPLQQRDAFVKRVIGMPGERIAIGGGNVHVVLGDGSDAHFVPLRRPAALQAVHWKDVHPARALVRGEPIGLGHTLRGEPETAWRERDGNAVATLAPERTARLLWVDADGGLVDRVWDGCPLDAARALRAVHALRSDRAEIVVDARVAATLAATTAPARVALGIDVCRPSQAKLRFAWEWQRGEVRLVVRRDGAVVAAGAPVVLAWPSTPFTLAFAHLDDELILWCDDRELARFDTTAFACRDDCELPDTCGMGPAMPRAEQHADVVLEGEGAGELVVCDMRIWRDQQWTRGPLPANAVLAVPAGHYLLLGDNPMQSEDGRGWRSFRIGELDGAAVPPDTPGALVHVGSLQFGSADRPPSRDENPVAIPALRLLVVRDELGDVHVLRGELALADNGNRAIVRTRDTAGRACDWELASPDVNFVPRAAFAGVALARYWPLPPFGPLRAGWLR
jgi:signal peptidase I